MKYVTVVVTLLLCFVVQAQQQNSPEPDLSAHKVAGVAVSYSQAQRLGEILLADMDGRIEQHLEIWGKSSNDSSPLVLTYVFDQRDASGRRFYTATWGKGPVERNAFHASCLASVPEFKDDVYWAAKVINNQVQFEPLEDSVLKEGGIKVLFRSVKGTTQRWMFESARPVTSQAPYDDQRMLIDLMNRQGNRKTWYARGWLRSENRCVRYLQDK
jgi:hypothetical protein